MELDTVPPYSPPLSPSPHYSKELLPGEQTIEFTRRASSRSSTGTGVYRRITDQLTIVLRDQHLDSVYPRYDRGEFIHGDVILGNTSDLTSVVLKVRACPMYLGSGFSWLSSSRVNFFFTFLGSLFRLPFFL